MEPTATVIAPARRAAKAATTAVAASIAATTIASTAIEAVTISPTTASVTPAASIPPSAAPAAPTPTTSPSIPRTGAYKHSAGKPVWTVIPVGRARVRRVAVVTVVAYGRPADSDRNTHLSLRVGKRQHQYTYQSQIFDIPHGASPFSRSAVSQPSNLQVFEIYLRSEAPEYLNSRKVEKLLFIEWLISATVFYFSHLGWRERCDFPKISARQKLDTLLNSDSS